MNENLEYAEDWLLEQLIKTDFEEKQTGNIIYARIKKKEMTKLKRENTKLMKRV